jgi:glycosyltransferase 2 family protein
MNTIPSNFNRYNKPEINFQAIPLSEKRKWICNTKVPFNISAEMILNEINSQMPNSDLLFDGCSDENKNYLHLLGYKSILFGKEAIIDLSKNPFQKKSLVELVKRGGRHGIFEEIAFSEDTKLQLQEFISSTSHGTKPQLKNLFAVDFQSHHRLFVLQKNGNWICAIMLSYKSDKILQTELILRFVEAPVGVMEKLIFEIFNKLKSEGINYWSLGAVPFIDFDSKLFSLSWFINFTGRRIKFAYNYKGLFKFKNKFNPIWEPYYICYKNNLKIIQIFQLAQKSNLNKLIIYNIFSKLHWNYGR